MRYRRGCQKSHQDNKIIFESETASLIVLNDSNRSKRDKERCNKQVRSDPVAFIKERGEEVNVAYIGWRFSIEQRLSICRVQRVNRTVFNRNRVESVRKCDFSRVTNASGKQAHRSNKPRLPIPQETRRSN